MRILIVEDETVVARRLVRLIGEVVGGDEAVIHLERTLEEARKRLEDRIYDLLFLDLNLHGHDGFDLLTEAAAGPFETIVVSAHTDRALEAFEFGVLDFVAKPFGRARIAKAIRRFRDKNKKPGRYLVIRRAGVHERIAIDQVLAIHGAGNYAEIETLAGKRCLHDKNLEQLERILPSRFVRVHRSHLVDWDRVIRLECKVGSRYRLVLNNDRKIPVGRGRVAEIKHRLSK